MHRRRFLATTSLLALTPAMIPTSLGAVATPGRNCLVFVGTYTGPKSRGIHAYRFDAGTGQVTPLGLAAATVNPTFLALHPTGRFLYAVNEVGEFQGRPGGSVTAFAIDRTTGKLALLNAAPTRGGGPCHLIVDRGGRNVLVANYGGGSVAVLPIGPDGRVAEPSAFVQHTGSSVHPQRQKEPHAHGVTLSPDERFLFVPDLGLDRLMAYRFDAAKGSLTPADPAFVALKPGAGPRHFGFHPNGRFAYAINELDSTVTAFAFEAGSGALKNLGSVSTLPDDFAERERSTTAELAVHPNGRFLFGSNRGHDSIAVFAIASDGRLRRTAIVPTQGRTPRHFAIDPTGRWLWVANQESDNIVRFRLDPQTGELTSDSAPLSVGAPVCLVFLPLD